MSAGDPRPPRQVVAPLQEWASSELRDLPWRRTRDPWLVLVSEIMLQQTQVSRVIERYRAFTDRFPTPLSCSLAASSEVIELWAGLGYNRRAVNLWRASRDVVSEHGGQLPSELGALLALPGVGPYTARAIQVFAFELDVAVVDTNVGRLLARWTGQRLGAKQAQSIADALVPAGHAWHWNQGLFDFAAAVCTKHDPACETCPLVDVCAWRGRGNDPAESSAGVSTRQSRFAGSDRQVRGRMVDALRRAPVPRTELMRFARPGDDLVEVNRIADTLVDDGLAVWRDDRLRLPD